MSRRASDVYRTQDGGQSVGVKRRFKPLSGRSLLAGWAVLSSLWALGVGYEVCLSVSVQTDMSRDVERDLDSDLTPASCTEPQCSALGVGNAQDNGNLKESWSDIASTYVKFGSTDMAESLLGPPMIIFAAGLGWIVFSRRRREARNSYNKY